MQADQATALEALSVAVAARVPVLLWGGPGTGKSSAVRAIGAAADVTFNLDVTLNRDHQVTAVFAGDLFQSHAAGCAFARSTAMVGVDAPFEVVLTTNSGYPLDQNLYQTVKGISAAAQIVTPGGAIVAASECSDGLPQHGGYKDLLRQADGPDAFLRRLSEPGFAVHDQWQVQVQALIQQKARVLVHAGGLSREQLCAAWFEAADEPAACAADLLASYGPRARMAVLPQGPQTIPYLT